MAQRFVGHHGPEVRAADANVDHIPDPLTGMAFPLAAPDAVDEAGHLVEHGVNIRHDVSSHPQEWLLTRRAQRHMQDGTIFRDVDLFARKHRVDPVAQSGFLCEFQQQLDRLIRDAVLRVVEEESRGFQSTYAGRASDRLRTVCGDEAA